MFGLKEGCKHDWEYHPISRESRTCQKCGQFEIYTKWMMPGYEHSTGPAWGIPQFAMQPKDMRRAG